MAKKKTARTPLVKPRQGSAPTSTPASSTIAPHAGPHPGPLSGQQPVSQTGARQTVGTLRRPSEGALNGTDAERLSVDLRMRIPTFIVSAVLVLACLSRLVTSQAAYGGLAGLAILHVLAYRREFLRARISLVQLAFVTLCFASIFWSVNRSTTIARMPSLLSFYLIAILVGPSLGVERLSVIFTRLTRVFSLAALIAGFALPEWAKDPGIPGETGWASLLASKNYLGLLGVLCFASSVLAPKAKNRIVWAIVAFAVVVESRSATSMALVFVTIGSGLFSFTVHRFDSVLKQRVVVVVLGAFAALMAASVVVDPTFATGLLGRDSTLTGRTDIWDFVWVRIKERPWLGHGYQAYWNVDNEFTIRIKQVVGFPVTSAHQALLDVLLSVGIVGAIITTVMLLTAILRTFGDRRVPGRAPADSATLRWARGIVLIYAIETFSESCLTNVFVVPLLLVISAITSQTTFFRHRAI